MGIRRSWPALRSVGLSVVLGTVLIVSHGIPATAEDTSKDQRQWWIDRYGLVDARTEPLVARAEEIFSRVAAAADKKGNRLPKLVVIGGKGDPYALTLKDSSIILTLEGLRICYNDVALETGDSRLAFLIGHELAHLAKDDFWHSNAFEAVSSYTDDAKVRQILTSQLEKTGGSLDFVKTQELQADSYGIMSMTMAGYDPRAIIGRDTNFFEYWVSQITGKLAYTDEAHISPAARAEFVRTELRPVIDALDRFNRGVRLYQSGDYQEAASLFEGFIEKYPGREVYNNLGLSRYQLALKAQAESSEPLPVFYQLPLVLDTETTSRKLQDAAAPAATRCLQNEACRANLQQAVRFFEEADKKDAAYLPARVNLSSALIMSGEYAKAISVADEILKVVPRSPEALNNKAVAEYLFSKKNNADNPNALAMLRSVAEPGTDIVSGQTVSTAAPPQARASGKTGTLGGGLAVDLGNTSLGPSIVWWPTRHAGCEVSFGRGTFADYRIRGLVRGGAIGGLVPYAGAGFLHVEREANVIGIDTKFSGQGGELVAGLILPLSPRISLQAALTANNVKLESTIDAYGQSLPVTMDYNPISVTATLVYALF